MLENKKYDYRLDIWALGLIMFLCLTGRHPFINLNTDTETNIKS